LPRLSAEERYGWNGHTSECAPDSLAADLPRLGSVGSDSRERIRRLCAGSRRGGGRLADGLAREECGAAEGEHGGAAVDEEEEDEEREPGGFVRSSRTLRNSKFCWKSTAPEVEKHIRATKRTLL
jgi:hypothetical protein